MKTRRGRTSALIAIAATVAAAVVGILANIATSSGTATAESLVNYLALAGAVASVVVGALAARWARRSDDESLRSAELAQRQSDSTLRLAEQAGVDPDELYDQVVRNYELPVEVRLIYAWSRLEQAMRAAVQEGSGDDFSGRPLGALIGRFADKLGMSASDKDELRRLLGVRNATVHSASPRMTAVELERSVQEIDRFTRRALDS